MLSEWGLDFSIRIWRGCRHTGHSIPSAVLRVLECLLQLLHRILHDFYGGRRWRNGSQLAACSGSRVQGCLMGAVHPSLLCELPGASSSWNFLGLSISWHLGFSGVQSQSQLTYFQISKLCWLPIVHFSFPWDHCPLPCPKIS